MKELELLELAIINNKIPILEFDKTTVDILNRIGFLVSFYNLHEDVINCIKIGECWYQMKIKD